MVIMFALTKYMFTSHISCVILAIYNCYIYFDKLISEINRILPDCNIGKKIGALKSTIQINFN